MPASYGPRRFMVKSPGEVAEGGEQRHFGFAGRPRQATWGMSGGPRWDSIGSRLGLARQGPSPDRGRHGGAGSPVPAAGAPPIHPPDPPRAPSPRTPVP